MDSSSTHEHVQRPNSLRRVDTFSSSNHDSPSLYNDEKVDLPSEVHFSSSSSDSSSTARGTIGGYASSIASVAGSLDTLKDGSAVTQLTFSRLLLAHVGAALTLFLATTDSTIVSTSLPTIIADLHVPQSQYPWVGISYLLTQTAFQPLYGRFSDLLGRKIILYCSTTIFLLGSLLCGVAPSYVSLCIFRAISGAGAGGIVSSVWLITSELVEERNRAKWSQALSVTWSASAVAGPLLGGLFSDESGTGVKLSWRWGFLINLPIGGLATLFLLISLRGIQLQKGSGMSWKDLWRKFDFFGLTLFMGGTAGVVLGFSFSGQYLWSSPATLVPLCLGFTALLFGIVYEMRTTRDALFPPMMFRNVSVAVILIIAFLHNFAFNAGTYFLALYYQAVDGTTALEAGMRMLPYSLGSSLASVPVAWFIGWKMRRSNTTIGQKIVITSGLAISTIGFGLMILLNEKTPVALQEAAPLLAGIGIGMLFHAPYQVLTMALGPRGIACATSAFFLVRFTGSTCGLAVASAMFNGQLSSSGDAGTLISSGGASIDLRALSHLQPLALRQEALRSVAKAIQSIWMLCTPCLGLAMLISPLIRTASTAQHEAEAKQQRPAVEEKVSPA
ncbi:MFS general substrate transporter [Schizopora paradoxa]|uniref:MFS general substrate transporter n=1 Tax=Schizopora paradoxa TaxID=27342 RepID=A0A0H2S9I5_9AGAM|nr:MFS general substrate transporter [Schizopora paradoxa]